HRQERILNSNNLKVDDSVNPSKETKGESQSRITPWQGVALIFGTNIGAGILSLPYAGRNGGFLALFLALLIAGILTTLSMMYVAEVSLRTQKPLQLSGLAEQYLGHWGRGWYSPLLRSTAQAR